MQTNLKRYAELRSGLLWEAMSGESRLDAVKIAPALVHGKVLGEAGKLGSGLRSYGSHFSCSLVFYSSRN